MSGFGRPERRRSWDFLIFKRGPNQRPKKSTLGAVVAYGRLYTHEQLDEANGIEPVVTGSSSFLSPDGFRER